VISSPFGSFLFIVFLALLAFQIFVLVDALIRPTGAYLAAGKLTKLKWVGILAGSLIIAQVLGFFQIVAVVVTILYLVDVRPALKRVTGTRW
jgi:hypothetical protein